MSQSGHRVRGGGSRRPCSVRWGDGGSGPPKVASVVVTSPAAQLEVGSTVLMGLSVRDGKGTVLTGRTVTWNSSAPSVASVDGSGIVTGLSAGSASIMATAEGVSGAATVTVVPVPVFSLFINERTPSVRQGEAAQLTARTLDAVGRLLTGRTITWSSTNATVASVSSTSSGALVTGIGAGTTWILAESEGRKDSVLFRVRSLQAPTVTSSAPATLLPGSAATVTGTNFSADVTGDEVYLNGAKAQVTGATTTSITFTVPAVTSLPCTATGAVPLVVVVNGDSATGSAGLSVATPRQLAVGASLLLTTSAELACNEFPVTGGKYLVTAFNYARLPTTRASFQLVGAAATASMSNQSLRGVADMQPQLPSVGPLAMPAPQDVRMAEAHLAGMELNRQLLQRRGNPQRALLQRRALARQGSAAVSSTARQAFAGVARSVAPVAPPNVGDMVTKRMMHTYGNYNSFDEVRFRVAYVGPKLIIMEDSLNPLFKQMDADYQKMGQEFDVEMFPFLSYFGDPLAVDTLTDNNGHVIALFSKRVNEYVVGGQAGGLLGFVTLCDFFPQTDPDPDYACAPSNEGEHFYAIAPNPGGSAGAWTKDQWLRYVRSTMIHEMKHVVMYAERIARDASFVEDTWLEEATAQQASELWSRWKYGPYDAKQDIAWAQGPACDYASVSASCPDPFEGILHHFGFLYNHYNANESKSILTQSGVQPDAVIYGSSWSFARWLVDNYGTDEKTFLRSLVQQQDDRGVNNVELRSGHPFSELFGWFSLASVADNYPGGTVTDPRATLASWNTRDLFSSMSQFLVSGNPPKPAFPRAWPLNVRTPAFGNFPDVVRNVVSLPGGGFAVWEISGVQTVPQALGIRTLSGTVINSATLPVGMAIVRVQ